MAGVLVGTLLFERLDDVPQSLWTQCEVMNTSRFSGERPTSFTAVSSSILCWRSSKMPVCIMAAPLEAIW